MADLYNLLIVDDSKVIRDGLKQIFEQDERINVIGEAANGREALAAINELNPDVITLDIAMPEMDGITTLKHLMIMSPTPTIMMSSLSSEAAEITFDALRYGAVDFIQKPSKLDEACFDNQAAEICSRVEYAASVEVDLIRYIKTHSTKGIETGISESVRCNKIVAIGAAEGGYSSLLKIIPHMHPDGSVAYLVSLYVAPEYIDAYAEYLNSHSRLHVKTAKHNEVLKSGVCYLSSGSNYMTVHKQNDDISMHISPAPFASRKGSIDMLMFSTAEVMGQNAIGIVLSGSGIDGTEGLEEISRIGGVSIVQDPATCLSKEMALSASENIDSKFVIYDSLIADVINDVIKN